MNFHTESAKLNIEYEQIAWREDMIGGTFPLPLPLSSNLSLWVPPYLDNIIVMSINNILVLSSLVVSKIFIFCVYVSTKLYYLDESVSLSNAALLATFCKILFIYNHIEHTEQTSKKFKIWKMGQFYCFTWMEDTLNSLWIILIFTLCSYSQW